MDRDRHHRNYDLHSWSGITLGLFIYVVCFTGCFALFAHEISSWEDPAKRLPTVDDPVSVSEPFQDWVEGIAAEHELGIVSFMWPHAFEPYYSAYANYKTEDGTTEYASRRWSPVDGAVIPDRGRGLADWILNFHRDLMWPDFLGGRQVGRGIVGVAGIILMLSILSGIVAHTKIFQELLTMRFYRSMRLKWQDTHKVVGLWGLPFFTMISFSGAVLGVIALLTPVIAVIAFKGDTEGLIEAVTGTPREATGVSATMLTLEDVAALQYPETDQSPQRFAVTHWGDEAAMMNLFYTEESKLATFQQLQVSGVTGDIIPFGPKQEITSGFRVAGALGPLHFGTFGGISLKLLYFILGLALSVITALGLMMWVERRLHGNVGSRSTAFYRALSKLTVGFTCGMPLATLAIFYADKLIPVAPDARLAMTGWVYFMVWFAALVFAFVRSCDYRATRELLYVSGGLAVGIPIINALATGDFFVTALWSEHRDAALVDLTFLLAGVATLAVTRQLPRSRRVKGASQAAATTTIPPVVAGAPAE